MAWTYNAALFLGAANTGLTLTAALFDGDGTSAAGMTTTYLAEKGSVGCYYFQAQMPDDHTGYVQFLDGATVKAILPITPSGSIEYIDQSISSSVTEITGEVNVNIGASIATASASLPNSCGALAAVRGDSWSLTITGLGDISGRSKLWFTLKDDDSKADTAALVQIEETAGLLYINGAAAGTAGNGDITVSDEDAGDITILLDEVESAKLTPGAYYTYDVQVLTSGSVTTLIKDSFAVTADITKATS